MTIVEEDFKEMLDDVIGCKFIGAIQIKDDRFVRDEFGMVFECGSGKREELLVFPDEKGYNFAMGDGILHKLRDYHPKVKMGKKVGHFEL